MAVLRASLSNELLILGDVGSATVQARRALATDPACAEALVSLAHALQRSGHPAAAEAGHRRALTLSPGLAEAHLNLGRLLLMRGCLAAGWEENGWRFAAKGYVRRALPAPAWEGGDPAGRALLVWREQGIGDELLYASCLPDLLGRAGRVILECDRRLVPLFARSFPNAEVRAESVDEGGRETMRPGTVDAHAALGDLPCRFRPSLSRFPPRSRWLRPDPETVAVWEARLRALGPGLRVGLCWRSQLMTTERRDAYTTMADWEPLFALPGIHLVVLQYDDCAAEVAEAGRRFGVTLHRWPDLDLHDDFEGTAALMSGLDLVITPATSIGELAGALGVPVWRLGAMDWTWLGTGVRPWYPTMRLFAPRAGEALADLPRRIAMELRHLLAEARHGAAPAPNASQTVELAVARYRAGDREEAERLCRTALDLDPADARGLHLLGILLRRRGEEGEAARQLARAVAADPANSAAWAALGAARTALSRPAADTIARALRLDPASAALHAQRAALLAARGRVAESVPHRRAAVLLDPAAADALGNLGNALLELERFAEAAATIRRALACDDRLAALWTALGNAEEGAGRLAEAEDCHRRALALDRRLVQAWSNLAQTLDRLGHPQEAAQAYDEAVAIDPRFAQARYNLSLLLLRHGDLRRGWTEHDWRFGTPQFQGQARRPAARPWRGENIAGARLLVWREQGVGDEILLASCYPDLIGRARQVIIECDRRLTSLFQRSFPAATVRAETADPRDADLHVPAGSLPRYLRADLARFPDRSSWLVPHPLRVQAWRERLAAMGAGLRVGIAWRSQVMTARRRDSYVPLDHWGPVFAVPGIVVVNLQYGPVDDELRDAEARFGVAVHRWPDLDLKNDFEGVAALIANLDLVISPALSVSELAGALGVPVWRVGGRDWTWLGTTVRPWFPGMRQFAPGSGESLADLPRRIADELRRLRPPAVSETPATLLEEAVRHHRSGRATEAASFYARVLEQDPGNPVALHLSGLLAHENGDDAAALPRVTDALRRSPGYAAAQVTHGSVLAALDRPGDAAASFRRALALQPANAAALTNLGNALDALGRSADAERAHRRSLLIDVAAAAVHDNLGVVLLRLGRAAEAEASHRQALVIAPWLATARLNLGMALRRQGRREEARAALRTTLALAPAMADATANFGLVLRETGDIGGAARWTARALALDSGLAAARFNGGVLDLAAGRLRSGWDGYDHRFRARALSGAARRIDRPAWTGDDPAGRRILVWGEQGVGDEILFSSCLPDLIARAGRVILDFDPRLAPLLRRSFPTAIVGVGQDCDAHIAAGSLPGRFRPFLAAFPREGGWLVPDPVAVRLWRERLDALGAGLKVGICWRSGLLTGDRLHEYTSLRDWAPVFAVPGLVLVNAQYDDARAEIAEVERAYGASIHQWPGLDQRNDLDGTAAFLRALDLVIAPAVSVGELAAAVGTPTWRFGVTGDWTALGTAVRPWYPAMRLFHPGPGETLAAVLARIAVTLRSLARG
nr:tetratricopeptide repeat protein [Azospirillum oleiclasticum]